MNMAECEILILNVSGAFTTFALNWMLQSTILIALGLIGGNLLQKRGAAFQSALYRTTLAAVIVCPIASFALSCLGLDRWSIELPTGYVLDEIVTSKREPSIAWSHDSFPPARGAGPVNKPKATTSAEGDTNEIEKSNGSNDLKPWEFELSPGIVGSPYPPAIEQSEIAYVIRNEKRNVVIRGFGFFSIVVTIAWVVVTSTKALRLVSTVIAMNRLRSKSIFASIEAIKDCKRIALGMGVKAPQVLQVPFITSPFLHGIWRPAIIIPEHADLSLTDVFVHELAHLRRFDCHWLLLRNVATTVLFFQPLLWLLARRIDVTSEEVCDDCVVQFGSSRERYANSLVDIAALSVAPASFAVVGMISLRSMLGRRVARILDTDRRLSTRISSSIRTFIIGTGLIAALIVGHIGLSISYPTAATTIFAQEKSNDAKPSTNLTTEFSFPSSDNNKPSQATKPITGNTSVDDHLSGDSKEPNSLVANEQRPQETYTFRGTVLEPDGKPSVGARVVAVLHQGTLQSLPSIAARDDELRELGKTITDETGAFSMNALIDEHSHISVSASKDGFAADETSMWNLASDEPLNFRLATISHTIKGRILDSAGRPAAGAKVTIVRVEEATEPIDGWIERAKSNPEKIDIDFNSPYYNSTDAHANPKVEIFPTNQNYITPSILSESPIVTDANGDFSIAGLGDDRLVTLRLDGDTIVSTLFQVVTRDMPAVNAPDLVVANRVKKIHGCKFVYASDSTQWIEGTIRDKLSLKPINDVLVYVMGADGFAFIQTRSDKEGRYLLKGLSNDPINSQTRLQVYALPSHESSYFPQRSWAKTIQTGQPNRTDIDLHRGIWIEGQATDARTHRPVPVVVSYHPNLDNPHFAELDINLFARDQESQMMRIKPTADGKFRVRGLPGKGVLRVVSNESDVYQLFSCPEMQKALDEFQGIPVSIPHPGHALVELDIPYAEKPYQVLPELVPLETTNLHFVDEEGREVTECFVEGNLPERYTQVYRCSLGRSGGTTYANSDVVFYLGEGEERSRYLIIQHATRKIGAVIAPEDLARFGKDASTTIVLRPNATVKGRLVNAKKEGLSGFPDAGFGVTELGSATLVGQERYGTFSDSWSYSNPFETLVPAPNPSRTSQNGSFERSLPAAKGYAIHIVTREYQVLLLRDRELSPGEQVDLGTIDVTADRKDWPAPRSTLNAEQR